MDILKRKVKAINGKEYELGQYFNKNDFVDKQGEGIFVLHEPLLRVAKEVLGIKGRAVQIVQPPHKANDWSTTTIVKYKFDDGIVFESSAEARIGNLDKKMHQYSAAMAETRASSRALRFALGVDICSIEEIGVTKNVDDSNDDSPIEAVQVAAIKRIIQKGVPMDKVKKLMSGKDTFEELSNGEATKLIQELQKLTNRKKS